MPAKPARFLKSPGKAVAAPLRNLNCYRDNPLHTVSVFLFVETAASKRSSGSPKILSRRLAGTHCKRCSSRCPSRLHGRDFSRSLGHARRQFGRINGCESGRFGLNHKSMSCCISATATAICNPSAFIPRSDWKANLRPCPIPHSPPRPMRPMATKACASSMYHGLA